MASTQLTAPFVAEIRYGQSNVRLTPTVHVLREGEEIAEVVITPASSRKYKLMEQDCVELVFNMAGPLMVDGVKDGFQIGDYIYFSMEDFDGMADESLLGYFYITEEPIPAEYDVSTGGYKYTLRFDREYVGWKNKLNQMVWKAADGSLSRRETEWSLTDALSVHAQAILDNLTALGYVGYTVDITAEGKDVAAFITYNGASIWDSLKAICDAYQCEWWVTGKVIHFGKCQLEGDPVALNIGDNVETITPNRNDDIYANRIWAFGSTKNIPETYRKDLIFKVTSFGMGVFKDADRPLSPSFFTDRVEDQKIDLSELVPVGTQTPDYGGDIDYPNKLTYSKTITVGKATGVVRYLLKGGQVSALLYVYTQAAYYPDLYITITLGSSTVHQQTIPLEQYNIQYIDGKRLRLCPISLSLPDYVNYGDSGVQSKDFKIELVLKPHTGTTGDYGFYTVGGGSQRKNVLTGELNEMVKGSQHPCTVLFNGDEFSGLVNPNVRDNDSEGFSEIQFGSPPEGFNVGSEYRLKESGADPEGILAYMVPSSYYTDISGDPNTIRQVGERRLSLDSYVGEELPLEKIVEKEVIFDKIYPRCALRITNIEIGEYDAHTEHADGSIAPYTLPAYTIELERITPGGDEPFPFTKDMLSPTEELKVTFLTKDEERKYTDGEVYGDDQGYMLSGMTFGVQFADGKYTIQWNSDYGAMLPNESLHPMVGDSLVLSGWNVKAMPALGLIASAEQEIADAADDYLGAIQESAFTFNARMMSDWIKANGFFSPGSRVAVNHATLKNPKVTRVIGYEYKLDIPYDSPVYTIGETEAYSRLKELERKMDAQYTSSASGVIQGVIPGGGGGGSTNITVLGSESLGGTIPEDNSKVFNAAAVNNMYLAGVALGNKVGEVVEE